MVLSTARFGNYNARRLGAKNVMIRDVFGFG